MIRTIRISPSALAAQDAYYQADADADGENSAFAASDAADNLDWILCVDREVPAGILDDQSPQAWRITR